MQAKLLPRVRWDWRLRVAKRPAGEDAVPDAGGVRDGHRGHHRVGRGVRSLQSWRRRADTHSTHTHTAHTHTAQHSTAQHTHTLSLPATPLLLPAAAGVSHSRTFVAEPSAAGVRMCCPRILPASRRRNLRCVRTLPSFLSPGGSAQGRLGCAGGFALRCQHDGQGVLRAARLGAASEARLGHPQETAAHPRCGPRHGPSRRGTKEMGNPV